MFKRIINKKIHKQIEILYDEVLQVWGNFELILEKYEKIECLLNKLNNERSREQLVEIPMLKSYSLFRLGKFDEAYNLLAQLQKKEPNNCEIIDSIGCIYIEKEEYNVAIDYFNKSISLNNNRAIAYYNRGVCHLFQNDLEQSLHNFIIANELSPNDLAILHDMAFSLYKLARYNEAIKICNDALSHYPNDTSLYIVAGDCYCELGKIEYARELYNKAQKLGDSSAKERIEMLQE